MRPLAGGSIQPSCTAARRYKRRQFHLEVCVFKGVKPIIYNGREVWPLIEGSKGVSATNHASAGAWAAAGGIGTVSAVNADSYDPDGKIIPQVYKIGGAPCRERVCQYV